MAAARPATARQAGPADPVLVMNAGHPGVAAYRDDPDRHVPDVAVDDIHEVLDVGSRPGR